MTPEDATLLDRTLALTRTKATAINYKSTLLTLVNSEGLTLTGLLALTPREVEDRLLDFYAHHRNWSRGRMSVMKCAVSLFGEANDKEYTFRRLKRALPAGNRKPKDRAPSIEEGRQAVQGRGRLSPRILQPDPLSVFQICDRMTSIEGDYEASLFLLGRTIMSLRTSTTGIWA
jgi:hypothetical protein